MLWSRERNAGFAVFGGYPHVEYTQETDIFDVHEFYVKADNVDVVCCSTIVNAITACFVTYWIFDIQYPKMFNNLLAAASHS